LPGDIRKEEVMIGPFTLSGGVKVVRYTDHLAILEAAAREKDEQVRLYHKENSRIAERLITLTAENARLREKLWIIRAYNNYVREIIEQEAALKQTEPELMNCGREADDCQACGGCTEQTEGGGR
jgi:hypothetical protein